MGRNESSSRSADESANESAVAGPGPPYRYRPEARAELARWGIVPKPTSDPAEVYALLKAIYTFEIRELKARRREAERVLGPQPLEEYRRGLQALKRRYPLLAVPARMWVEGSTPGGEAPGDGGARRRTMAILPDRPPRLS
jgi:hypothetical protein